jgi:hypothetical protein
MEEKRESYREFAGGGFIHYMTIFSIGEGIRKLLKLLTRYIVNNSRSFDRADPVARYPPPVHEKLQKTPLFFCYFIADPKKPSATVSLSDLTTQNPSCSKKICPPRRRNSKIVILLQKTARRYICKTSPTARPHSSLPVSHLAATHPTLFHTGDARPRRTPVARLAFSPPPLPLHLALSFFVRVHMAAASTAS